MLGLVGVAVVPLYVSITSSARQRAAEKVAQRLHALHWSALTSDDSLAESEAFALEYRRLGLTLVEYDLYEPGLHGYDDLRDALERVEDRARSSTLISIILAFLACFCLLQRMRREAVIDAQDMLAKQQAHETRNRYGVAISTISAYLDGEDVRADMESSLELLKEVEHTHATRLMCYKLLRGTYTSKFTVFDLARLRGRGAVVESPEVSCITDVTALEHILSNTLRNARKFSDGVITLSFKGVHNGQLVFTVKDQGCGIPAAIRDKIFDQDAMTGLRRGTGLGLPSSALFCKAVGGYIKIKSTDCTHTEIEFALRGKLVDHTPDLPRKGLLPINSNVVIVDDSTMNRKVIERSLSKVQPTWTFAHFPTVEAALPTLLSYDIVTMDENMQSRGGQRTGSDAITWLRGQGFKGLIVSSSGDAEIGKHHMAIGADIAWGKPIPRVDAIINDLQTYYALH